MYRESHFEAPFGIILKATRKKNTHQLGKKLSQKSNAKLLHLSREMT
jgi:hypothetical protein